MSHTTIAVSHEFRAVLSQRRQGGESYEQMLRRELDIPAEPFELDSVAGAIQPDDLAAAVDEAIAGGATA